MLHRGRGDLDSKYHMASGEFNQHHLKLGSSLFKLLRRLTHLLYIFTLRARRLRSLSKVFCPSYGVPTGRRTHDGTDSSAPESTSSSLSL